MTYPTLEEDVEELRTTSIDGKSLHGHNGSFGLKILFWCQASVRTNLTAVSSPCLAIVRLILCGQPCTCPCQVWSRRDFQTFDWRGMNGFTAGCSTISNVANNLRSGLCFFGAGSFAGDISTIFLWKLRWKVSQASRFVIAAVLLCITFSSSSLIKHFAASSISINASNKSGSSPTLDDNRGAIISRIWYSLFLLVYALLVIENNDHKDQIHQAQICQEPPQVF